MDQKFQHPPRTILLSKIKEVTIPLSVVPELIWQRLVTEKSGPGFLLLWNDVILERLSSKELVLLLFKLNDQKAFELISNYEQ